MADMKRIGIYIYNICMYICNIYVHMKINCVCQQYVLYICKYNGTSTVDTYMKHNKDICFRLQAVQSNSCFS